MATWSDYLTFDVLSDLCFGKSFGVLDREENRFVVPLVPRSTEAVYTVSYSEARLRKTLSLSRLTHLL